MDSWLGLPLWPGPRREDCVTVSWGPHVHLGSCLPPGMPPQSPQPADQASLVSRVSCHLVEPLGTSRPECPFQGSMCSGTCDLRPPPSDRTQGQAPRSQGRGFPAGLGVILVRPHLWARQPSAVSLCTASRLPQGLVLCLAMGAFVPLA